MPAEASPALEARGLSVVAADGRAIVRDVSFSLAPGEVVGLTGPSGSGKSTLALALLGLARGGAKVTGAAFVGGKDLIAASEEDKRRLRGKSIALVLQNARGALDPLQPIGPQIAAVEAAHAGATRTQAERRAKAVEMLRLVGVNDPERRAEAFAHELSGGMAQRALIGMALAANPAILVADEPTSGLDVTVQAQFLDQMWRAAQERGFAMLLVTQEPGVLANYCDRVLTLEDGRLVADESARAYFARRAARKADLPPAPPPGPPLLTVAGLRKTFPVRGANKRVHAADGVDFEIKAGECVGLVGESGSGKSTVGRAILRLIPPEAGLVRFEGADLAALGADALRRLRAKAQLVRQDPFDSFDPRWTLGRSVREPLDAHGGLDPAERETAVAQALTLVGCPAQTAALKPAAAPAGLLQKVALARAIVTRPALLVLDEPTSMLAPEAREELIAVLRRLQIELGLAALLISHDLATIQTVCQRVAVMYLGQIVEVGPAEAIFAAPKHPYTRALIAAHLGEDPTRRRVDAPPADRLEGEIPSPIDLPTGCRLASRCAFAAPACAREAQVLQDVGPEHAVRCARWGEVAETPFKRVEA